MPAILSGDPGTGGVSQVATAASGGGEEDSRGRIIKYSGTIIVLCRYLLSVSFIYISDPGLIFCGQPAFTEPFLIFYISFLIFKAQEDRKCLSKNSLMVSRICII